MNMYAALGAPVWGLYYFYTDINLYAVLGAPVVGIYYFDTDTTLYARWTRGKSILHQYQEVI